jgi:hypothetical protein
MNAAEDPGRRDRGLGEAVSSAFMVRCDYTKHARWRWFQIGVKILLHTVQTRRFYCFLTS